MLIISMVFRTVTCIIVSVYEFQYMSVQTVHDQVTNIRIFN